MARIRNVSPRFFEDDKIAKLSIHARLFYIGLWTRCDLNGVFEWSPKVILAALFPHDDDIGVKQFELWMGELLTLKRVLTFMVGDKKYGLVPNFVLHQAISKAERDNDLRARNAGRVTMPIPVTDTITVIETVLITPDEGRGTKDEGQGTKDSPTTASSELFLEFWNRYGKKQGKQEAAREWAKLNHSDQVGATAGVTGYITIKPDPQFRLDACRYLKRRTWEDEAVQTPTSQIDYGKAPPINFGAM